MLNRLFIIFISLSYQVGENVKLMDKIGGFTQIGAHENIAGHKQSSATQLSFSEPKQYPTRSPLFVESKASKHVYEQ